MARRCCSLLSLLPLPRYLSANSSTQPGPFLCIDLIRGSWMINIKETGISFGGLCLESTLYAEISVEVDLLFSLYWYRRLAACYVTPLSLPPVNVCNLLRSINLQPSSLPGLHVERLRDFPALPHRSEVSRLFQCYSTKYINSYLYVYLPIFVIKCEPSSHWVWGQQFIRNFQV